MFVKLGNDQPFLLDCVSAPDITVIVIGLIGGIVGIGLLLLIVWKQYVSIMVRTLACDHSLKGSHDSSVTFNLWLLHLV